MESASRATPNTTTHILILDDDAGDRAQVKRSLKQAGFTCNFVEASTFEDAIGQCEKKDFDCAIVDYRLPGHDGLEGVRALHASYPYLPIIMVTGQGDEVIATEAMKSGAADYINKSRITAESIRRVLVNAFQKAEMLRSAAENKEELERFTYALAHDFKQPIRQIQTFGTLVNEAIDSGNFADVRQHLDFLTDAAKRLGMLVDVMSQYTMLHQIPPIGAVELSEVLQDLCKGLENYRVERHGEIHVDPLPRVSGNAALLAQIFQNLILNGLKYNTSAVPRVDVSCVTEPSHCVISVKDNGIGIDAEFLDEIFKPLVRLHSHSEYSGTGLGLTLARKAASILQGALWCRSVPGKGTEFYVKLKLSAS